LRIKNIYIRDFGIFNNQQLNNLNEGIIFIGGHNRSGKSSFLEIIRHLGFALPKDGSIPPAKENYYIQADLENKNNYYSLSLSGYANANITSVDGEEVAPAELYNHLDKFTYQQLFTISLDELQQISNISTNSKKQKKLYSMLLGAGLSEIIRVPEIAENYYKKAGNIGGKRGDPSVADFKPFYNKIKSAENEKEKALLQLDQFIESKNKLKEKEEIKIKLKEQLKNLKKEEFLLDILKNNYKKYTEIEELEFKISEQEDLKLNRNNFSVEDYKKALELKEKYFKSEKEIFSVEKEISQISSFKDDFINTLLDEKNNINKYINKKDILIERINNNIEAKEELKKKRMLLENETAKLNSKWDRPLKKIESIDIDDLKQSEIARNIEDYKDTKEELKNIKEEKYDLKQEIKVYQQKIENMEDYNPDLIIKKTYLYALFSVITGITASFFNINTGIYISGAFLFITYIFYSSRYSFHQKKSSEKEEIIDKLDSFKLKLEKITNKEDKKEKEFKTLSNILENYRRKLDIDDIEAVTLISDYYRTVQDKKSRLEILKSDEEKLNKKENKINIDLHSILDSIRIISNSTADNTLNLLELGPGEGNLLNEYQEIFIELDKTADYLEITEKYIELNREFEELKKEINNLLSSIDFKMNSNIYDNLKLYIKEAKKLQKYIDIEAEYNSKKNQLTHTLTSSDKIRTYLLDYYKKYFKLKTAGAEEKLIFESFADLYSRYSSLESAEKEHQKILSDLEIKFADLEEIDNQINRLNNTMEQLASSEDIKNAHQKINEARINLKNLAERYAVNKSVYFILSKLRERIINRAEDELLTPAAELLSKITDDEYQAIETSDDLEAAEFKTILADGSSLDSVTHLSRGTMEQLFLAVRLSRIREIKPPLPVVLDDSLVNFDRSHLYNTVEVISEFAKTHQIFILSCHPHFVRFLKDASDNVQYWKLDKGKFSRENADNLIKYLDKIPD
jgi:uncharacterized protein YhaN